MYAVLAKQLRTSVMRKHNRKGKIFYLLGAILLAAGLYAAAPEMPDHDGGTDRQNYTQSEGSHSGDTSESLPGNTLESTSENTPDGIPEGAPENTLCNTPGNTPGDISENFPGVGQDSLQVHVLDVGQGLSVLIQAGDSALLYDGGNSGSSSFVVAYLQRQGIKKLDYIIASHYDADHLSGIIGALNVFETGILIAPDYEADTKTYLSFRRTVSEKDITITAPQINQSYPLGQGAFQILAPVGTDYPDENNYSIVVQVTLGETSLLLTGDAALESEEEMLQGGWALASDVLLISHHGSNGATSQEFLEAVSPAYAIISCGLGNDYGHPAKRVMELLEAEGIAIYRTDLQGTIRFSMTMADITFESAACENYSSGEELTQTPESISYAYILNTNSKKIHLPECPSVAEMSEKNKKGTNQTLEELIDAGYSPCGICKP